MGWLMGLEQKQIIVIYQWLYAQGLTSVLLVVLLKTKTAQFVGGCPLCQMILVPPTAFAIPKLNKMIKLYAYT